MTDSLITATPLDDLVGRLEGRLVRPGDIDWDAARRAWNLGVDQRPEAVVLAASPRDVVATVDAARGAGMRVAPQSTGHNAGPLGDLAGTLLLRMDEMSHVDVDPVRRVARVEGGARWGDLTARAARHGLCALAGSAADVGVAGYTLGGGVSWLARSHGLAANSVISLDVVTADGTSRRVGPDADPDLFWALRGGGGSFGIVTALEITLYPVQEVYAGTLFFPIDRAAEVLRAWREWSADVPDTVMSVGRVLRFPPLPDLPAHLRGQNYVVVEAACQLSPAEADRILAPLRALRPVQDTFARTPTADLALLHMDPVTPVPARGNGALLSTLPTEAIDAVAHVLTSDRARPLLSFEFRHLGGMLQPGRMAGGAVSGLDGQFAVFAVGMTPTPESVDVVEELVRVLLSALRPWVSGAYLNFAEEPTDGDALFGSSVTRLREIKLRYDPADLIRSNHPIA